MAMTRALYVIRTIAEIAKRFIVESLRVFSVVLVAECVAIKKPNALRRRCAMVTDYKRLGFDSGRLEG